ncbi:MAG: hypothetical protein WAV89_12385 [Ignavibacteriaceae bacterium]
MSEATEKEQKVKIIGRGRRALRIGVNIFVFTFVGIFMLLMIFFGISQTQVFKDWLRDTVVEVVNGEINGKLSIDKIEGTIFTSLKIKNTILTSAQNDTVVYAGNIELKTSPLKILFKDIYIRKFELSDTRIKLVEESDGQLNLLKIFPSSADTDTTSSEFPFAIEVADFRLKNVNLSMQKYDKVGSTESYPNINMDDLRINDLNVSFNAYIDLNKYEYRLTVEDISFNPNFKFFNLKHLSGTILLTPKIAGINKLHLVTDQSDFELNAGVLGIDLLKDFSMDKLGEAPIRFSLNADKINFEEITTYVPPMEMLSGTISTNFEASGTLNDLQVKKIAVNYNNTSLEAIANIKNLLDADNMFINISFSDSYLDPSDPSKLFKKSNLPEYKEFGIIKFDTLTYAGTLSKFNSRFAIRTDKGDLNGGAVLNFLQSEMQYDVKLFTKKMDLSSFISIPTNFNSEIKISGTGTNPQNMKMQMSLAAGESKFGNTYLKEILLNSTAKDGLIKTTFQIASDSISVDLNADIDFEVPDDPSYELNGKINELNIGRLLQNKSLESKINLTIEASGQGFNPDSMDIFLVTDIKNSSFSDFNIDSTRLILDVRRNDNGKKIINIVSDIADFTISGNYSIATLGNVISREAEILDKTISEKINPVFSNDSLITNLNNTIVLDNLNSVPDFNLDYLLDFKESLTLYLNPYYLQIDGQMKGNINSLADTLAFVLNADFNYLKFWSEEKVLFVVNTKFACVLNNHLINGYRGNINADISFNSERLYAGSNIYNLSSKILFDGSKLSLNTHGDYEDKANAKINALALFNENVMTIKIDTLDLIYNKLKIYNPGNLVLSYKNEAVTFNDFLLNAAGGTIKVDGSFGANGDSSATFSVDNVSGEKIAKDLIGLPSENKIKADINIKGLLSGNFSDPKFSISANANDIFYANSSFGSLVSKYDYANNSIKTDIRFIDSLNNFDSPKILVTGFVPLELSSNVDSTKKMNEQLDLTIQSFDYDLSALSDIFPYVRFQKGKLETDIYVTGTISKPAAIGYFSIKEARFKIGNNNLDYDLNTKIWIDDEVITIESVELKNVQGTKYGGTIKGEGIFKLKNFRPDSSYVKLSGDLKVLDDISKSANPYAYGDLALQTRGDIVYTEYKGKAYLSLPVDVTVAELTIPLNKSAYASSSGFIYKYNNYNIDYNKLSVELDSLIQLSNKKNINGIVVVEPSKFDYTIDIKLDTEAEVAIILSKELDQNLNLILGGDFFLESVDGKTKSGGALKLLEGSKLSFIKTFEATGNVSFEKLNNPIIDITGTYKDYYTGDEKTGGTEQEVAVKIKLKGPLSELNQNFVRDENNIGVYIGKQNIEEDKKDASKSASDAFFFIITGNFADNATQQDKNAVASTATSLAGSVLGGFLNQYLGDYVKSVQLRQVGAETKFSLLGKAGDFKYEIGGSTDVFQDLSRANIKIEYPITQRLQLKLERKESENQLNSINNPLFNQLGLKYNFEF